MQVSDSRTVAAAAAKQQPDAVFWQETHDAWERYLTQRFMDPMPYALFQYAADLSLGTD